MRVSRKRRLALLVSALLGIAIIGAACGEPDPPPPPAPARWCPPAPGGPVITTIFNRTQSDRSANGLGGMSWNPQLACLATDWSAAMASTGNFSHRDLGSVIRSPGYENYASLGENILVGPGSMTGDAMQDAWMNSPGHRANILGNFNSIGIGLWIGPDGRVWATENFGRWF